MINTWLEPTIDLLPTSHPQYAPALGTWHTRVPYPLQVLDEKLELHRFPFDRQIFRINAEWIVWSQPPSFHPDRIMRTVSRCDT